MILDHIQIKNFRSIKSTTIHLDPTCRILVGINESGKSNLLKALALLGSESEPVKVDDLREPLPDEDPLDDAYVRFIFRFEKEESDKLFEAVGIKILSNTRNPKIATNGSKVYTLKELCAVNEQGLYKANILSEEKSFHYYTFDKKYNLHGNWKKPTNACPQDFTVMLDGKEHKLLQYKLIKIDSIEDIPESYLEDASINDITALIGSNIIKLTEAGLPDTIFWKYEEKIFCQML